MKREMAAGIMTLKLCEAEIAWQIQVFGEHLSKKNSWNLGADEAISLHIAKKYGWTLEHCHSLSHKNLALALHEDLKTFVLPEDLGIVARVVSEALESLKKLS
jgi:hypothetical protein